VFVCACVSVIASSISDHGVWSDELIYSTRKSSLPNQLSEISTSIKTQLSVIGSNLPLLFFFSLKKERKKERKNLAIGLTCHCLDILLNAG
jgi:hypothetical protein